MDHASEAVYAVPGWAVAVSGVLLGVTAVGCALVVSSRQVAFPALVVAGTALAVLGFLAAASIGLLVLPLACGLLIWAGAGRWAQARRARAVVGAVLAGVPLPVLAVFAIAGPLVDCHADGVTSGENLFLSSSGGSASMSSGDASGTFTGRSEGTDYAYSYACRDGRLVRFDLRRD